MFVHVCRVCFEDWGQAARLVPEAPPGARRRGSFTPWDDLSRVSRIGSLGRAEIAGMLAQADGRIVARLFLGVLLLRATRGHSNHTVPVLSSLETRRSAVIGWALMGPTSLAPARSSRPASARWAATWSIPLSHQACTGSLLCLLEACPV